LLYAFAMHNLLTLWGSSAIPTLTSQVAAKYQQIMIACYLLWFPEPPPMASLLLLMVKSKTKFLGCLNVEETSAAQTAQAVFKMPQSRSANAVQTKLMREFGTTIAFYVTTIRASLDK
jgi:hypothetical protein